MCRKEKATCVFCKESHPVNFKGCREYQKFYKRPDEEAKKVSPFIRKDEDFPELVKNPTPAVSSNGGAWNCKIADIQSTVNKDVKFVMTNVVQFAERNHKAKTMIDKLKIALYVIDFLDKLYDEKSD